MSNMPSLLKNLCLVPLLVIGTLPMYAQYYGANNSSQGFWHVGIRLGSGWVDGDVSPQLPNVDFGIYTQKQLNRYLDVRFSVNAGEYSGQDFTPSQGFLANPVLNGFHDSTAYYSENSVFFQNFNMRWLDANFQLKINLNRLFSEYGNDKWDAYLLMGIGSFFSQTKMDAFSERTPNTYDFQGIFYDVGEKVEILEELDKVQDGIYESYAERDLINSTVFRGYIVNSQILTGMGIRFQLSERVYTGFQAEYNFIGNDLLDGQQWMHNGSTVQASLQNDRLLRLGLCMDFLL